MHRYIIGLIAADGHNGGSQWSICQTIDGIDIFESINEKYGYKFREVKKSDWGKQRKFVIKNNNKKECAELVQWNIPIGNKTYSLDFPINKNKVEMAHYLRGFFDGDGCISGGNEYPRFEIMSNKNWCEKCKVFHREGTIIWNEHKRYYKTIQGTLKVMK